MYGDRAASCESKKKYDKRTAETVANIRRSEGHKVRIYPCDYADHWHLSKTMHGTQLKTRNTVLLGKKRITARRFQSEE